MTTNDAYRYFCDATTETVTLQPRPPYLLKGVILLFEKIVIERPASNATPYQYGDTVVENG